jgi:hypothetical protein
MLHTGKKKEIHIKLWVKIFKRDPAIDGRAILKQILEEHCEDVN